MKYDDYQALVARQQDVSGYPVRFQDLMSDLSDRTLIYGYTTDRQTFHAYIKDQEINAVVYGYQSDTALHYTGEKLVPTALVPNKRVYPACSDKNFCEILIAAGAHISFTTFEPRSEVQYHGELKEDFDVLIPVDADWKPLSNPDQNLDASSAGPRSR